MDLDEMYEPHLDVTMDADDLEILSITQASKHIQENMCTLDARMKNIQTTLHEQEELRKAAVEYSTIKLKRKYGLEKDSELRQ
ncbi:unnamed protein product, partial [Strongylus vulgaris]